MKAHVNVTDSLVILQDNVRFRASFFIQDKEFNKAFDKVSKDIKAFTEDIEKLGVDVDNISVSPVQANANWVRQAKESNDENAKVKEYEYVQKGFVARGTVFIELPLLWSNENNKFSDIYFAIDKYKTKNDMSYEFFAKQTDIDAAKADLRAKLLDTAKTKLLEIFANQSNVKCRLVSVSYLEEGANSIYAKNCIAFESASVMSTNPEPKIFDAGTIDNLISIDFAPEYTINDNISTKWKVK